MTPEQRNNLIGAVLIGIALLQLIPVLPSVIDFIAVRVHQDFFQEAHK
ncbi:hypothetical protein H6F89_30395 [Cyanobacteria bacterium FACHB-63]|nr:hypothetical protein [Cyanobacteria bacterium FACHB-63]